MGCYPLGKKLVSKMLGKCNGGDDNNRGNRSVQTRVYSPAPTYTHTRAVSRSVTFSNNNPVYIIPPEPAVQPEPVAKASYRKPVQAEPAKPSSPEPDPVRRAGYGYGYGYRYVPSPLPRWERTPRRHEYFSGEYNYYPTPVREGIYSIATDANRLTTIFSEENPNASCIKLFSSTAVVQTAFDLSLVPDAVELRLRLHIHLYSKPHYVKPVIMLKLPIAFPFLPSKFFSLFILLKTPSSPLS